MTSAYPSTCAGVCRPGYLRATPRLTRRRV